MDENIIDKVKKYLLLQGEYDVLTLVKLLTKARYEAHPDRYPEDKKEQKTEEFKNINNLLTELKKYAEQQCSSLPVKVSGEGDHSLELINTIGNLADANDKICKLEKEVELLTYERDSYRNEIERLKEQISRDTYKEQSENIASSLQSIYKQSNKNKIWSSFSFISIVLIQIKEVKALLNDIFGDEKFVMSTISIWAFGSLLFVLYKSMLRIRITHYQNKLTNTIFLKEQLSIHKDYISHGKNDFFTESDIVDYVWKSIRKEDKMLFSLNKHEIIRQLTDYVILNLNKKKIIKSATPDGIEMVFELNITNKYSSDLPF